MTTIQKLLAEIELEKNTLHQMPQYGQWMQGCIDNKLNNLLKMAHEFKQTFLTDAYIRSRIELLSDIQVRLVKLSATPMYNNDQMSLEIQKLEIEAKKQYQNIIVDIEAAELGVEELRYILRVTEPGTKWTDNAHKIHTLKQEVEHLKKQNEHIFSQHGEIINKYKGSVLKLESEKHNLEKDLDLLDRQHRDLIKEHDQTKANYESRILQLTVELEKAKGCATNVDSNTVNHFHGPTLVVPCISKDIALQLGNQGLMIKSAEEVQQYPLPIGN